MQFSRRISKLILVWLLALSTLVAPAAFAAGMVSAATNTLNMRSGPGTGYTALWTVDRGYPFKVLARKGNWLKVSDFERDSGWVYAPMTRKTPYHVVSASSARLRATPNGRSAIVVRSKRGDVLQTLGQRGNWVRVRHERGVVGWVAKSRVWGW